MKKPHVVILGAGASVATIPNGDKSGNKISAKNGFIEKLNLIDVISKVEIQTKSNNLEDIYMELDERSKRESICKEVKEDLERRIYTYMSNFRLPDEPTIYDYLILSLSKKDLIATFNWDPLLVQAAERASKITNDLPHFAFLHGNVGIGYCEKDCRLGPNGSKCRVCGETYIPTQLLYPVKNKNYNNNYQIKKSWEELKNALEVAYMLTIFGYSAPKSDESAISLLKYSWGEKENRFLEEIEIVDLKKEEEIENSWNDFIFPGHCSCYKSFFETTLAKFPKLSCEALYASSIECRFLNDKNGFTNNMSFEDVKKVINRELDFYDLKI